MHIIYKLTGLISALALLSGCTITQDVQRITKPTEPISKIYILENSKVLMEGLLPEIEAQLASMGYATEVYWPELPDEATHYMHYTANWKWDMAMYLTYFEATLFEEGRVLGSAEYDARFGGANMGKFGKTADKIRPLLEELLIEAK